MFALFYVVLAPFVGAFADSVPKGRVMFVANTIKVCGCLLMLFGSHPLLAYAMVGLGAAAYSPAKYGILTELLPPSQLVKANGWIEGLTIGSIILGTVRGRRSWAHALRRGCWASTARSSTRHRHPAEAAITVMLCWLYVVAALFNLFIPRTEAPLQPMTGNLIAAGARLLAVQRPPVARQAGPDLAGDDHAVLGRGRQPALHRARLGRGRAGLRHLAGVAAGRGGGHRHRRRRLSSRRCAMRLDRATSVIPLGTAMGVLRDRHERDPRPLGGRALPDLLGALGGYLVVPMNALLQHRGHNLMGAGRSIAVQNFNEQACILGLGAFYTGMTKFGLSAFGAIAIFGLVVSRHDGADPPLARGATVVQHRAEVEHLLGHRPHGRPLMARRSRPRHGTGRWRRCCSTPSAGACPGGRSASSGRWACIPLWQPRR
jgi:LPLT family lysophospholipid transporter-like MFS transporter